MKWNLRLAAASRGIWKASELRKMLADRGMVISAGKMSGLWSGCPDAVKLVGLDVICAVLGCEPGELLIPEPVPAARPAAAPPGQAPAADAAPAVVPHRRQLRRRDPRAPVPGIPPGEVLVRPQAVEPVPHPHCRRPGRVAGPRHPRGQLRDLDSPAGMDRHLALLRDLAGLMSPQDWPRASLQSAKYQDSRQSQA